MNWPGAYDSANVKENILIHCTIMQNVSRLVNDILNMHTVMFKGIVLGLTLPLLVKVKGYS